MATQLARTSPVNGQLDTVDTNGSLTAIQVGVNAVRETMDALKAIRTFVKEELKANVDFGVIPGTGQKPALLQPGAQKTAMYFNATPDHHVDKTELGNGHVEFLVTTRLINRSTGVVIGMGLGSCSTMESKYRYRKGERKCPKCSAEAIIKGKEEYGGGWLCFRNKGGCGAKFGDRDQSITGQPAGKVENPDIYDQRNTVLKMAIKRSFVAASLSLGCLSELFTQDIEETYDLESLSEAARPHHGEPTNEGHGQEQAPRQKPQNNSGYATGMYASPEQSRAYLDSLKAWIDRKNVSWLDRWTLGDGEIPKGVKDLLSVWQADKHLLKWCVDTKRLDHTIEPDDLQNRNIGRFTAIVYHRSEADRKALGREMERYADEQAQRQTEVVYRNNPEMFPDEGNGAEEQGGDEPSAVDAEFDREPGSEG